MILTPNEWLIEIESEDEKNKITEQVLKDTIKLIFNKYLDPEGIKLIHFYDSTPYFNDGDPFTHSSEVTIFKTKA